LQGEYAAVAGQGNVEFCGFALDCALTALAAAQQHSSGKQRGKARPQPWEIMT
jgi:hypothetical protein